MTLSFFIVLWHYNIVLSLLGGIFMIKTMSLKLDENLISDIKRISELFNMSSSEFVRNAIKKEIEEKKNDFIVRMSNVPYCEEKEEKELIDMLNKLSDDDLTIVKRDAIELC